MIDLIDKYRVARNRSRNTEIEIETGIEIGIGIEIEIKIEIGIGIENEWCIGEEPIHPFSRLRRKTLYTLIHQLEQYLQISPSIYIDR